jgi:hypothetical protein
METVFAFMYIEKYFENLFKNHWTRKIAIYMKAFGHSTKIGL